MYIIILLLLMICTVFECLKIRKSYILFNLLFIVMTFMLCFRYGQGTDYFGYHTIYFNDTGHVDRGFSLIVSAFRAAKLPFEYMVFTIGMFQMWMLWRFLKMFCPYRAFSMLMIYPTIYLTYFFSGIRQGIAIALFLGVMLGLLWNNGSGKPCIIRYTLCCIIAASVHNVAIVLLVLLVIRLFKVRQLYFMILVAAIMGGIIFIPEVNALLSLVPRFSYYVSSDAQIYLPALLERILMMGIIAVLSFNVFKKEHDAFMEFLLKIYIMGFIVYIVLLSNSFLASRMGIMFKCVEVTLVPYLVYESLPIKKYLMIIFLLYTGLVTIKNINSYIHQTSYTNVNEVTYPYISVFGKERLWDYHLDSYIEEIKRKIEKAREILNQ